MKKQSPFFLFISVYFGALSVVCVLLRGFTETSSKLIILGNKFNFLIMLFRQVAEICFLTVLHFWTCYFFRHKLKLPLVIPNLTFLTIYLEIFVFSFSDYEMTQNGGQMNTPSIVLMFMFKMGERLNQFSEPAYAIKNLEKEDTVSSQMMKEVILSNPLAYLLKIIFLVSILFLSFLLAFINHKAIIKSTFVGKFLISKDHFSESNIKHSQDVSIQDCSKEEKKTEAQKIDFLKAFVKTKTSILIHILGVVYLSLLLFMIFKNSDNKLGSFSSVTYLESCILAFSHYEKRPSKSTRANAVNLTREYLPPGRRWLDNRPDPVYPAVHGDLEAFCSYNKNDKECLNFTKPEHKPLVEKLPNVVLISYESFSPNHYLISDEFLKEHANLQEESSGKVITETKYYNPKIMKNLNKFQDYAMTFSGMSTLGMPTASGFHGLLTGLSPSQSIFNAVDGTNIQSDDFPSQMRNYGYKTLFVSPARPEMDCLNLWFWRRSAKEEAQNRLKCIEAYGDLLKDSQYQKFVEKQKKKVNLCSEKKVEKLAEELKKEGKDFEKWFDYFFNYFPTSDHAKLLNLDPSTFKKDGSYIPDRITFAQFKTHWTQIKNIMKEKGENKPISGSLITIESHIEFFGYDKEDQYEMEAKRISNKDEWIKKRFIRVNAYTDKQIGELLEWLKENEPNTIFAITGDHGARKVPIEDSDEKIFDDIVYSSDCVHQSSGTDSFFVTSGMIGYLGDDPVVKDMLHLDKLKGKTLKIPTDHNDLIYTIEDIITKLNGTSIQPTHRRNRNLIDLSIDLSRKIEEGKTQEGLKEIDDSNWRSYSLFSHSIDFRQGTHLLRTHPADFSGSHYYRHASYPQCIRKKNNSASPLGTDEGFDAFDKMFKIINAENYITLNNRLYNFQFRDYKCIEKGECNLPNNDSRMEFYDYLLIHFFILLTGSIILIELSILEILSFAYYIVKNKGKKKYIQIEICTIKTEA